MINPVWSGIRQSKSPSPYKLKWHYEKNIQQAANNSVGRPLSLTGDHAIIFTLAFMNFHKLKVLQVTCIK